MGKWIVPYSGDSSHLDDYSGVRPAAHRPCAQRRDGSRVVTGRHFDRIGAGYQIGRLPSAPDSRPAHPDPRRIGGGIAGPGPSSRRARRARHRSTWKAQGPRCASRAATTLPIAEVPNLLPGGRVAIKADFPGVAVGEVPARRGSPARRHPAAGFLVHRVRDLTGMPRRWPLAPGAGGAAGAGVPRAPVGNGFGPWSARLGRPGAFVRAAQQLNQASLDRAQLEIYLRDLRETRRGEPGARPRGDPLLARSLAIRR